MGKDVTNRCNVLEFHATRPPISQSSSGEVPGGGAKHAERLLSRMHAAACRVGA